MTTRLRALACFTLLASLLPRGASAWTLQEAGTISGASAPVSIALSDDDQHLAVLENSGLLKVFHVRAVSQGPASVNLCSSPRSLTFIDSAATSPRFYVGCAEGQVFYVSLNTASVPASLSASEVITVNGGVGDVEALISLRGDGYVYAFLVDESTPNYPTTYVDRVSVASDLVEPNVVGPQSPNNVLAAAINRDGSEILITQDNGSLLRLNGGLGSYTASLITVDFFGAVLQDVVAAGSTGGFYFTEPSSGLVHRILAGGSLILPFSSAVDSPGELVMLEDGDNPVLLVAGGSGSLSVLDLLGEILATGSASTGSVAGMVASSDPEGPVYVAGSGGSIVVLSDAPWIDSISASPTTVREGEDFILSFRSSMDCSYDVRLGGDGTASSGVRLATGDCTAAEAVQVSLNAADLGVEGINQLFVLLSGASGVAVDSVLLTLDLPPGPVGGFGLEAGQQRVVATWSASDAPDLSHYLLYLSDAPFTSTEQSLPILSIPRGDGGSDDYPRQVDADLGASEHRQEILGLSNGQRYYAAIQAVDASEQRGSLSAVASAEPNQTGGAAAAAGETAQASCSSCGGGGSSPGDDDSAALLPLLLLGFGLRRRERM